MSYSIENIKEFQNNMLKSTDTNLTVKCVETVAGNEQNLYCLQAWIFSGLAGH